MTVCLLVVALMVVPSPLFFEYKAWRIAGELGENFLNGIRDVTDSLPANVSVVAINCPYLYVESRSDYVETRSATILYPKTVRAWAELNDMRHEIVIFGVSKFEGEFTTPEVDFSSGRVVRVHFETARAEYIPANDPHVRQLREIAHGWKLSWPPQDLASARFQVYVFDGKELVRLVMIDNG